MGIADVRTDGQVASGQPHPSERTEAKRLHVLVSYAYWSDPKHQEILDSIPQEWNVMLDSGAFTNFTMGKPDPDLDAYAEFCDRNAGRFWKVINLDRIGDPEASERNHQYLLDRGIPAIPVFTRGESLDRLLHMGTHHSLTCIGGISQQVNAKAEQDYLTGVLRYVHRHRLQVHLLGVAGLSLFRNRPYSGDSSTWLSCTRYGSAELFYRGKFTRLSRTTHSRPSIQVSNVLRSYGLTWEQVGDRAEWSRAGWETEDRRSAVFLATVRSYMRLARAAARINSRQVFAATPSDISVLRTAWELERDAWR